jgi:hypothetical protein
LIERNRFSCVIWSSATPASHQRRGRAHTRFPGGSPFSRDQRIYTLAQTVTYKYVGVNEKFEKKLAADLQRVLELGWSS